EAPRGSKCCRIRSASGTQGVKAAQDNPARSSQPPQIFLAVPCACPVRLHQCALGNRSIQTRTNTMNHTFVFGAAMLAVAPFAASQNLVIPSGGSITYEFADLPRQSGFAGPTTALGNINVRTGLMSPGDAGVMRIEMFETSTNEVPIWAQTFNWTYGPQTHLFADWGGAVPDAWLDRQGAVRVSVLDGFIRFQSFTFESITPSNEGMAVDYFFSAAAGDPLTDSDVVHRIVVLPHL